MTEQRKGDGSTVTVFSSDHCINVCTELSVYVSFLFTGLLTHGALPKEMVTSTVIPITKGRSGHSHSDIIEVLRCVKFLAKYWI